MPPKSSPPKKKGVDFEQSLSTLESLVNRMEQGDMTLEESLHAFESGIALTRECQTRLAAAEQQVGAGAQHVDLVAPMRAVFGHPDASVRRLRQEPAVEVCPTADMRVSAF